MDPRHAAQRHMKTGRNQCAPVPLLPASTRARGDASGGSLGARPRDLNLGSGATVGLKRRVWGTGFLCWAHNAVRRSSLPACIRGPVGGARVRTSVGAHRISRGQRALVLALHRRRRLHQPPVRPEPRGARGAGLEPWRAGGRDLQSPLDSLVGHRAGGWVPHRDVAQGFRAAGRRGSGAVDVFTSAARGDERGRRAGRCGDRGDECFASAVGDRGAGDGELWDAARALCAAVREGAERARAGS